MSPLYRGDIYCFTLTAHLLVTSVLCLCVIYVYHAGGQTRDVDPMPGYSRPTVYDAKPALAQYWFTVSCSTPREMWASVIDGGPTLTQSLLQVVVIVRYEPIPSHFNRPKSLKNKQKTTTRHTANLECTQQALVLTNVGPLSTTLAQN